MSPDALTLAELQVESGTSEASPSLPEGWAWASLGEMLPLEYGKALPERLRNSTGKVAVYGSSGRVGWHTAAMVAGPTLIVGRKGSAGAVFYCDEDCWPIDTVYFAKPKPAIDLRFGFYFLKWKALARLDQSTAIPSLSRDIYSDVVMPIAPLSEQLRIVARIDELFAEIAEGEAALERARQGLDTWRRALLKAAVTGELTCNWREANCPAETGADLLARIRAEREAVVSSDLRRRSPKGLSPNAALLPELPEGWVYASFWEFIARIEAGLNVKAFGRPPETGETGIVKVSAVTWGEFDELASKTLPPEATFDDADIITPEDFLFSRANTLELVGAPVIVKHCTRRLLLSDKVLRIRLAGGIDHWIEIFLKSPYGRQQIEAFSTGNQLSMRNISQENIRKILIPLPSEEELCELLRVYDIMECAGVEATQGTSRLGGTEKALRQSILKAAFEGRLVPQDPADEPAYALLTRLRNGDCGPAFRRRSARPRAALSHPSLPGLDPTIGGPAGDEQERRAT